MSSVVSGHLDHQLRGRASKADASFVKRLAAKLDCAFEPGRTDVAVLARDSKQSIETAGRMTRFDFFAQVALCRRCTTVFLGHHADDLVETFLMNLFRGSGPAGFGGMREIASRRVSGTELKIVRPLLGVWREEIDAYVKAHGIEFRARIVTNESLWSCSQPCATPSDSLHRKSSSAESSFDDLACRAHCRR